MAERTPILKLLVNVPLDVTVSAVYYAQARQADYSDQLKVRGVWTGRTVTGEVQAQSADVYLPLPVADELIRDGLVAQSPTPDRDGHPAYTVQAREWTVQKEQGPGGKTFTRVVARGGLAPRPAVSAAPVPVTVKRQEAGPGMPKDVGPRQPQPSKDSAPDATALWTDLDARYGRCVDIVKRTYYYSESTVPMTADAFVAAVATLFIEANRRNLPGLPPVVRATPKAVPVPNDAESFADFPTALDRDDGDIPF